MTEYYELYKLEVLNFLLNKFDEDKIVIISNAMDIAAQQYKFDKQPTELIAINEAFPEVLKNYIAAKAVEGLKPESLQNYTLTLSNFFRAVRKPFDLVTTNDIRIYLFNYRQTRQVKPNTLDKIRANITLFFEWCVQEGLLTKNPGKTINVIKTEEKPVEALTPLELEYIRSACMTIREKAIIDFLYSTGCRVSELCHLKKHEIDWDKKKVYINNGKGGKSRYTYINPECEISLRAYLASRSDHNEYVFTRVRGDFPEPLSRKAVQECLKKIVRRVQDKVHCKVTPHTLRRTAATIALHNGMPVEQVQNFLGHANIRTTMFYAKVNAEDVQNSHSKFLN